MNIHPMDHELLRAFLRREAQDFRYRAEKDGPEALAARIEEAVEAGFTQITEKLATLEGKADWISVQSLTNLGLRARELLLTAQPWESGLIVDCLLPPCPCFKGSVNVYIRENKT